MTTNSPPDGEADGNDIDPLAARTDMPVGQFYKQVYVPAYGPVSVYPRRLWEFIEVRRRQVRAENAIYGMTAAAGRPLTRAEYQQVCRHTYEAQRTASYEAFCPFALALVLAFRGRHRFRFPFVTPLPIEQGGWFNPRVFPHARWPLARDGMAVALWQGIRLSSYVSLCTLTLGLAIDKSELIIAPSAMRLDPQLRDMRAAIENNMAATARAQGLPPSSAENSHSAASVFGAVLKFRMDDGTWDVRATGSAEETWPRQAETQERQRQQQQQQQQLNEMERPSWDSPPGPEDDPEPQQRPSRGGTRHDIGQTKNPPIPDSNRQQPTKPGPGSESAWDAPAGLGLDDAPPVAPEELPSRTQQRRQRPRRPPPVPDSDSDSDSAISAWDRIRARSQKGEQNSADLPGSGPGPSEWDRVRSQSEQVERDNGGRSDRQQWQRPRGPPVPDSDSGQSAWDRVRSRSQQADRNNEGAKQPSAWERVRIQASREKGAPPPEEDHTYSPEEVMRQAAKAQAQKEFDDMVEAERSGGRRKR